MYRSDGCLGRENRFYSIGVFCREEGEEEEEELGVLLLTTTPHNTQTLLCYKTGSLVPDNHLTYT